MFSYLSIGSTEKDDDLVNLNDKEILYQPGSIIVTCRPYVYIVADSMKNIICNLCLTPTKSLNACSDCRQIFLCNSCNDPTKSNVFKTIHKLECSWLVKHGHILSSATRLFLNLYLQITDKVSIQYQGHFNPLTKEEINFDNLVPNFVLTANDFWQKLESFYSRYVNNQENKSDDMIDDLFIRISDLLETKCEIPMEYIEDIHLYKFVEMLEEIRNCDSLTELISDDFKIYKAWEIYCNLWSFTIPIYDETITGLFSKDPIAYGLYLEPSVIINSHSCIPNCSFAHYGPVLQLRAIKHILKGENLTINYVDLAMKKKERIIQLQNYLLNICLCSRCYDDSDEILNLNAFNELNQKFIDMFNGIFFQSMKNSNPNLPILPKIENPNYAELFAEMYDLANELDTFYEKIYPDYHPEKSKFLFAFTTITMNYLLFKMENDYYQKKRDMNKSLRSSSPTVLENIVKDIDDWSKLLKRTWKSFRNSHGVDHGFYRDTPIPLAELWIEEVNNQNMTLEKLYSDPINILFILCSTKTRSTRKERNYSVSLLLDSISSNFMSDNRSTIANGKHPKIHKLPGKVPIKAENSKSLIESFKIGFRSILIICALLFQLFLLYFFY